MGVTIRLSVMMFLQFFIWGAWYVTVGTFMTENGMGDYVAWAYTVAPIAAILSPFFLGLIADRFFATERVLGVMHLLGGAAMLAAPYASREASPTVFVLVLFLHTLAYMPTLGLTNTLAFHNITNQEKQFPVIRVFGTIGWIVANFVVAGIFQAAYTDTQFLVTAAAAFALGVYSFTLPHTPPPAAGKKVSVREIVGADALGLLKQPSFAVFVVCSFLICIPLAAYYAYAPIFVGAVGSVNPFAIEPVEGLTLINFQQPPTVTLYGQITEIVFMLLMPLFFVRLGVKYMLLLGMFAWVVRYGLFYLAIDDSVLWMVFAGVLLHGICYDFFFVTGFIYTDKKCTKEIRGQAQGLLVLVTQGLGLGIGAQVVGAIAKIDTTEADPINWRLMWLVSCIFAGAVMLIFWALFRDDTRRTATAGEATGTPEELP